MVAEKYVPKWLSSFSSFLFPQVQSMINARQAEMEGVSDDHRDTEEFLGEVLGTPSGFYWPYCCGISQGLFPALCFYNQWKYLWKSLLVSLFPDFSVLYACISSFILSKSCNQVSIWMSKLKPERMHWTYMHMWRILKKLGCWTLVWSIHTNAQIPHLGHF